MGRGSREPDAWLAMARSSGACSAREGKRRKGERRDFPATSDSTEVCLTCRIPCRLPRVLGPGNCHFRDLNLL